MCDEKGVVWLAQIRSGIIGILADASVYLPASSFGADAGIVGCTAEKAGHRRSGLGNSGAVLQHLNRMPPAASIDTDVSKDVRLMIDPHRMEGEEVVSSAVMQLIFRTKVSDNIIGGQSIERKPTEVVKHVSKDQLVEIVRAYREEHEDLSTQVDQPAISNMVVGDKHGDKRSLRWEVGEWFSQEGLLDDEALQHILTEPIAGFRWVAASAVPPAAQRPAAPATSARGWKASWNDMWGWVYSNTAGVRRLLDPGEAQVGEERVVESESIPDEEARAAFTQPGARYNVDMEVEEEADDGQL